MPVYFRHSTLLSLAYKLATREMQSVSLHGVGLRCERRSAEVPTSPGAGTSRHQKWGRLALDVKMAQSSRNSQEFIS